MTTMGRELRETQTRYPHFHLSHRLLIASASEANAEHGKFIRGENTIYISIRNREETFNLSFI